MEFLPLSAAQSGIWFRQKLNSDNARQFNLAQLTEISGDLDTKILGESIQQTFAETQGLQVRIVNSRGRLWQATANEAGSDVFHIIDLHDHPKPPQAINGWVDADLQKAVNIANYPMFRFTIFKISTIQYYLCQRFHHITFNGFSCLLWTQRLSAVYSARVNREIPSPCSWQRVEDLLSDEAEYRASRAFRQDRQFWCDYLTKCPEPATLSHGATSQSGKPCVNSFRCRLKLWSGYGILPNATAQLSRNCWWRLWLSIRPTVRAV